MRRLATGRGITGAVGIFSVLLIATIWSAVVIDLKKERGETIAAAHSQHSNLAIAFEEHTIRTMKAFDAAARLLGHEYNRLGSQIELASYMQSGLIESGLMTAAVIIDDQGETVASSSQIKPQHLSDAEYFTTHVSQDTGRLFVGKPVLGRVTGRWTILMSRRINKPDGSFGGVVAIGADPSYFTRFYQQADLGRGGLAMLVKSDGIVLARRVGSTLSFGQDISDSSLFVQRGKESSGSFLALGKQDGTKRFVSFRSLNEYPLVVAVGAAENEVLAQYHELTARYVSLASFVSIVIVAFAALLMFALKRTRQTLARLVQSEARLVEDIASREKSEQALLESEARFRQVTESIGDVFFLRDVATERVLYVSPAYERIWDRTRESLYEDPTSWAKSVDVADRDRVRRDYESNKTRRFDYEYRIVRPDGEMRWIRSRGFPVLDAAGTPYRIAGVASDITDRMRDAEMIRRQAARQSLALKLGQRALESTNVDELLDWAMAVIAEGLQLELCIFLELGPDGTLLTAKAGSGWDDGWIGRWRTTMDQNTHTGRAVANVEAVVVEDFDGDTPFERSSILAHHGVRSAVVLPLRGNTALHGVLGAYSRERRIFTREDVSFLQTLAVTLSAAIERTKAEQRLAYLAQFDTLTGLPNRTLYYDRLGQALADSARAGTSGAVMIVNIDRLKLIIDTLGHDAADALLKQVAARLGRCVRTSDTVARLGADEFALLVPKLSAPERATVVARKISDALAEPIVIEGREVFVTTSTGIAIFPTDGTTSEVLVTHAHAALCDAQQAGNGKYRFHAGQMNDRALQRLGLENDLRHALSRGEFVLHFQPKVSLLTNEIAGLEALLRWNREGRIVSPGEFMPVLEESGLIAAVGEWVLCAACKQIKSWREDGLRPLPVAVNLSARQLHQQDVCGIVDGALRESGVAGRYLELEITESAAMRDPNASIATLHALKALGVRLAIDDFGTGYSSLSYLKRLPLDTLKVDRSFVTELATNPDDASLTQAIIEMAHKLHLKVVAEGVETAAQLAFLASHGCDEIQGYYFSRPIPASEATEIIRRNPRLQRADLAAEGDRTLLLVDDEANVLASLKRLLRRDGYRILTAADAQAGFEILASEKVGVIVSDQRMPAVTGVEFLRRVKNLYPDSVRMVLSGYTDLGTVTEAINEGAIYKFLTKPWDDDVLRAHVAEAFRRFSALQESNRLQRQTDARVESLAQMNLTLRSLLKQQGAHATTSVENL